MVAMFATTSKGILSQACLEALLGAPCVLASRKSAKEIQGVVGWGMRPSSQKSRKWAARHDLPFFRIEDGFIRSLAPGQAEPGYSLVVDDLGLAIDATRPSRLEALVCAPLGEAGRQRARALAALWRQQEVSKYNHAPNYGGPLPPRYVLAIDQTAGDASIAFGQADEASFSAMLQAALDENPGCQVMLKVHPEVASGRKRGYFDLASLAGNDRVIVVGEEAHAPSLLRDADALYTVTSQMGFEGLLWGKPVHTFGMPFYAGWGLTNDRVVPPDRRCGVDLENLVFAALVAYSRYVHPETGQRCEPEALIEWMGWQRRMRTRFAPRIYATGFSPWKHWILGDFLQGIEVSHVESIDDVPGPGLLAVWSGKCPDPKEAVSFIRVEDGFIRSVGLGAELVRPLSWVFDQTGIYYDATRPSDLEEILAETDFGQELIARARSLRERIIREKLTKYNVGARSWSRPVGVRRVSLVTGQVETDASIKYGASEVFTNLELLQRVRTENPEAYVVYKPHPDVVAGLREPGSAASEAVHWCDEIVTDCSVADLFPLVDDVHVLTSLSGFEALLREKKVYTYGQPFFAGWGLTEDRCLQESVAGRRARRLSLDELVAGTLILYPTYISRDTGCYTTPERTLDELGEWRAQEALPLRWTEKLRRRIMRLFSR